MNMLVQNPVLLRRKQNILILQTDPQAIHLLGNKLEQLCGHLEVFQEGLPKLLCSHGAMEHKNNIALSYKDGKCSVAEERLIQFVANGIDFLFTEYEKGLSCSAIKHYLGCIFYHYISHQSVIWQSFLSEQIFKKHF